MPNLPSNMFLDVADAILARAHVAGKSRIFCLNNVDNIKAAYTHLGSEKTSAYRRILRGRTMLIS